MAILVSFCNLRAPGTMALGLLDPDSMAVRVIQASHALSECHGVTGLALSDRHLFVAVQSAGGPSGSSLLIFDRRDLRLLRHYPFRLAKDVHSLWPHEGRLYAVSTGTDEVVELRLRGEDVIAENVFWRPEPDGPREDLHHLNAICSHDGRLIVSGFGKKNPNDPQAPRDGFLRTLGVGPAFHTGLDQPHSVIPVESDLVYCESRQMTICRLSDHGIQRLPGYTRGLCAVQGKLFVATSVGRLFSKSTGLVNNPAAEGKPQGDCTISRLSLVTLEIEETIDLGAHAHEIYDLLPVDEVDAWPIASEIEWRNETIHRLSALLDQRTAWAKQSTAAVAQHEATIQRLSAELESAVEEQFEMRTAIEQQNSRFEAVYAGMATQLSVLNESVVRLEQQSVETKEMIRAVDRSALLPIQDEPERSYCKLVARIARQVRRNVPRGATVLVASKGDDRLLDLPGRQGWHFPQTAGGIYAGSHPACDLAAIAQLEALKVRGAGYLLLPSSAFWWLDHYQGLTEHLENTCRHIITHDDCRIFDLRAPRRPKVERALDCQDLMRDAERRLGRPPSILDWNSGLNLAQKLSSCTVFSPPTTDPRLPYLEQSVDVVVVPRAEPLIAEARRVAQAAVITVDSASPCDVEWLIEPSSTLEFSISLIVSTPEDSQERSRYLKTLRSRLPHRFRGEILELTAGEPYVQACNETATRARGDILVFFSRPVLPLPQSLTYAVDLLAADETVAAAAPKLVACDGRLEQAGGVIFSDGSLAAFGSGDYQVEDPLYGFVRDVDFSGDAVLITTRSAFTELEGLAASYRSAGFAHADYCLRAGQRGLRTVYQPECVLIALTAAEGGELAAAEPEDRQRLQSQCRHLLSGRAPAIHFRDRDAWQQLLAQSGNLVEAL